MKRLLWGVVALGLFLGVTGQTKTDYMFTTLDPPGGKETFVTIDFPGAIFTDALGINPRLDIVGTYTGTDGKTHGFLLSREITAGEWSSPENLGAAVNSELNEIQD